MKYYNWDKHKQERLKKKKENEEQSIKLLRNKGFEVEVLNLKVSHYRIREFDFWPTTGKFYNQKTKEKGRGVKNLIKSLGNNFEVKYKKPKEYLKI